MTIFKIYHYNHQGSVALVTWQNGTIRQHLQYLPYGDVFVDKHRGSFASPYTFSAKEKDSESGYNYFGARYYTDNIMMWLSVDPMSDKNASTSPYMYCAGNPIKYMDLYGMDTILFDRWGRFSEPHVDGNDKEDIFIRVNDEEFRANKIDYGKNGGLRRRHSNKMKIISRNFMESHITEYDDKKMPGEVFTIENYFEAKKIFEFFADNTDVEWAHVILEDVYGNYTNKISTSHKERHVLIPSVSIMYNPIEIRHSHPTGCFFSPADKSLYEVYNKEFGGSVVMRIYQNGFYHNFDDKREYPNLESVPSY